MLAVFNDFAEVRIPFTFSFKSKFYCNLSESFAFTTTAKV